MTTRCFVTLKPMRAGLSGYARIQTEAGSAYALISARGIKTRRASAYFYRGGGELSALGSADANARGELSLEGRIKSFDDKPDGISALIIIGEDDDSPPVPLLFGLCSKQSAGSLMDARNVTLALCERLKREMTAAKAENPKEYQEHNEADSATPPLPLRPFQPPQIQTEELSVCQAQRGEEYQIDNDNETKAECPPSASSALRALARAVRLKPRSKVPTREIFLPAIDPLPYVTASEREVSAHCVTVKAAAPDMHDTHNVHNTTNAANAHNIADMRNATDPLNASNATDVTNAPDMPNVTASIKPPAKNRAFSENKENYKQALAVNRLPDLSYPREFDFLKSYFDTRRPENPLGMKGWRFVRAEAGGSLLLGGYALDGRIARVAYALKSDTPPDNEKPYRAVIGADGSVYQLLVQRVRD